MPTFLASCTILGITPGASADDIRAAYKKKALETHPDKGGNPEQFRVVREAYDALCRHSSGTTLFLAKAVGVPRRASPAGPTTSQRNWRARFGLHDSDDEDTDLFGDGQEVPLASRPIRPPKRTMEDEIRSAFQRIPTSKSTQAVAKAAASAPELNCAGARAAARKLGGPASQASKALEREKKLQSEKKPKQLTPEQLWDGLTKLSDEQRVAALGSLDEATRANLRNFLQARKRSRTDSDVTTPCTQAGAAGPEQESQLNGEVSNVSSSDSSSSSSSSDSSDEGGEEPPALVRGHRKGAAKNEPVLPFA